MTLLHQTQTGAVPEQSDLQDWVEFFPEPLTGLVVSDPQRDVMDRYGSGQPRYTLLAPGAEIVISNVTSVSDAEIEAVLPLP